MSPVDIALRLLLAAGLGGLVGIEREYSEQAAGFRTHILVSLGAALFTVVGAEVGTDPSRVAAQVVTGIGFLGGGAILRQGANIRGLTTAAALWVAAAAGTAAGFGYWEAAVTATVLTVISLYAFKRIEVILFRRRNGTRGPAESDPQRGQDA